MPKFIMITVHEGEASLLNAGDIVAVMSAKQAVREGLRVEGGAETVISLRTGTRLAVYDTLDDIAERFGVVI